MNRYRTLGKLCVTKSPARHDDGTLELGGCQSAKTRSVWFRGLRRRCADRGPFGRVRLFDQLILYAT
jgi:hypothetical protein